MMKNKNADSVLDLSFYKMINVLLFLKLFQIVIFMIVIHNVCNVKKIIIMILLLVHV